MSDRELEVNPEYLDSDGNIKVLVLPRDGDRSVEGVDVICLPGKCQEDDSCGCEAEVSIETVKRPPWDTPLAICPFCGGNMIFKIAGLSFAIAHKGPGLHSSAFGRRRKKDFLRRHDELGRTQWENVEPEPLAEGRVARNPTPGGPYDPNGPFVKKKGKPKHFDQGTS